MTVAIAVLVELDAGTNGANDVGEGVATLVGTGSTRYQVAVAWGTFATLAGSVASIRPRRTAHHAVCRRIVNIEPSTAYAAAVLAGVPPGSRSRPSCAPRRHDPWIVGALVGAGLVASPAAIQWRALGTNVAAPLLASVGAAFAISAAANAAGRSRLECVCVQPAPALGFLGAVAVRLSTGARTECRVHRLGPNALRGLHWASSGAASFARGANATPKIAAIAAIALVPASWSTAAVTVLVGASMATGSLLAGTRVAPRLAHDILRMDDSEGLRANLAISLLVGIGANRGLPMSTTHVATGAIAGASGGRLHRLNRAPLGGFGAV